jgi:cell division protein FtsB
MRILTGVFSVLKNKYIIATMLFISWMLFFDLKDWPLLYAKREKLKELDRSELHFNRQIAETRQELGLLKTSAATIEKYAREKYLMKKDNEDLFIVISP